MGHGVMNDTTDEGGGDVGCAKIGVGTQSQDRRCSGVHSSDLFLSRENQSNAVALPSTYSLVLLVNIVHLFGGIVYKSLQ
jgi:hypothetical protein